MGVHNATRHFQPGVLFITPGDREDIILAAAARSRDAAAVLAGIVLTGGYRPGASVLRIVREMPCPVLWVGEESYAVASTVYNITVKTRAEDTEKIAVIRDLVARHVDLDKILGAL